MFGSAKLPVRSSGDGYHLRGFQPADMMYLIDIDAKCSEFPWTYDQWLKNCQSHTGSVVTFYGTPVGFALFHRLGEYVELVKLAVKPHYRRQKLGMMLMSGCFKFGQDMGCHTVFCVLPETMLAKSGEHEPAISFLKKLDFVATKPMLRDCFNFDGRSIDGVKFIQAVERTGTPGEPFHANRA